MNEKNFDYLQKQIKFTGFGEGHAEELKQKMAEQKPDFTIFHQQDYGKTAAVATLQFRKSDEGDMYFFNRYSLLLKNEQQADPVKQTFYINPKEDNITLKEAYNLMEGRAVHKEMSPKEGEKYQAWLQLDFKATDKHGNFELKKFHENYGFRLDEALGKHPIKELGDESSRQRLMESLERGNRQSVTFVVDGKEQKIAVEAAPQYKSLNFYDADMRRVNVQKLHEKPSEGQSNSSEQKQETKKEQAKKAGDEEDAGGGKQKRKRRQGVH